MMRLPSSWRRLVLVSLVLVLIWNDVSADDTTTTFTVYDNGSSKNGIHVTLSETQFAQLEQESASSSSDNNIPPGEGFAVAMSTRPGVVVSKYKAPQPVLATRAYREDGELITSFEQLKPYSGKVLRRIYLVAEGLEFIWPFVELGHNQTVSTNVVPPIDNDSNNPVILESVSDSPRVFRVYNMATPEEATAIIESALNATGDNALQRSTVGGRSGNTEGNDVARQDVGRTSDNAWDSTSPVARKIMTRSFQLTNIAENDGKRDGLQVVRYQPGQGYNTHPDYFTSKDDDQDFDFHPYSGGSNRFATVFMYLNTPEEGGATVFPRATTTTNNVGTKQIDIPKDLFKPGTWQERVHKDCQTKLAVSPQLGTAALFYSITPDGRIDPKSHHAACPLVRGTKWGANIWIWNKQRYGDIRTGDARTVMVHNTLQEETVYISWEGRDNGSIPPGQAIVINSYEYHRFKASFHSHKDKAFDEFTVQSGQPKDEQQVWEIKKPRQRTARMVEQQEHDKEGVANEDESEAVDYEEEKHHNEL